MTFNAIRILATVVLTSATMAALGGTYTAIDFPGAAATEVTGINSAGVMVGFYTDNVGAIHGYQLDGDGFRTIDYPGATSTLAFSVSSSGDVAGFFLDAANQYHGFVLSGRHFFVQDYPGATTGTFTLGTSANGTQVGEFKAGHAYGQLGFAWILRHGQYTQLFPPDCNGQAQQAPVQAFATSVNPRGDVVGRLIDASGRQCAWKLDKQGVYSILQPSGASLTNARGVNSIGEVVGVYRLNGVNHGFVLPANDAVSFTSIDFPGATATRALGINARGDIVGTFADVGSAGTGHGFLLERDNP